MKARASTNPNTSGVFRASIVLWSRSMAVWPLTFTLTLSTVPSVWGISRSRRAVSACFDASLAPLPASVDTCLLARSIARIAWLR